MWTVQTFIDICHMKQIRLSRFINHKRFHCWHKMAPVRHQTPLSFFLPFFPISIFSFPPSPFLPASPFFSLLLSDWLRKVVKTTENVEQPYGKCSRLSGPLCVQICLPRCAINGWNVSLHHFSPRKDAAGSKRDWQAAGQLRAKDSSLQNTWTISLEVELFALLLPSLSSLFILSLSLSLSLSPTKLSALLPIFLQNKFGTAWNKRSCKLMLLTFARCPISSKTGLTSTTIASACVSTSCLCVTAMWTVQTFVNICTHDTKLSWSLILSTKPFYPGRKQHRKTSTELEKQQ